MNRLYWNYRLRKLFHLSKDDKITYFRNPDEFNYFYYEKINPTHKAIIWGRLRKTKRLIKMGKISFSSIITLFNDIYDKICYYLILILDNVGICLCLYYIFLGIIFMGILLNLPLIESFFHVKRYIHIY